MEPISSEVLVVIIRQFHPGIHRGCFRLVKPLKMVYFQGLYEFTRGYVIYIYGISVIHGFFLTMYGI